VTLELTGLIHHDGGREAAPADPPRHRPAL